MKLYISSALGLSDSEYKLINQWKNIKKQCWPAHGIFCGAFAVNMNRSREKVQPNFQVLAYLDRCPC